MHLLRVTQANLILVDGAHFATDSFHFKAMAKENRTRDLGFLQQADAMSNSQPGNPHAPGKVHDFLDACAVAIARRLRARGFTGSLSQLFVFYISTLNGCQPLGFHQHRAELRWLLCIGFVSTSFDATERAVEFAKIFHDGSLFLCWVFIRD
jgi:hypothetical protein